MNTGEKIDYMIQCLKAEALIRDNLRNVARMGFRLANEVK